MYLVGNNLTIYDSATVQNLHRNYRIGQYQQDGNTEILFGGTGNCVCDADNTNAKIWIFGMSNLPAAVPTTSQNAALQIYPNPASTEITVETPNPNGEITINNVVGQTLKTMHSASNKTTINIADLPSGMYIIRVSGENNITNKFIKQ